MFKKWFNSKPKGLTLPDYKYLSNHDGDIKKLPIYDKYYISLLQRDGEKAIPKVKIGDKVKKGDVIAIPTSHMALHRHAPTSGKVTAIVKIRETHISSIVVDAVEITADGFETSTQQFPPIIDYKKHSREQLLARIFKAGIAGMGGAGFPTEKKINLSNPVETLIINGAECEPYITCDDILMRHYAENILQGAQIFAHILKCRQILVGIEDNKPEAINAMQLAAEHLNYLSQQDKNNDYKPIVITPLPTKYPIGSRHQIAHFLLGKKPNIYSRSYQSGFICHNVATAKAAYDAIILGKPLTDRLITFSGDGVGKPGVYLTKCGSNINDLANSIKLDFKSNEIIFGGTMMGFAVSYDSNLPMTTKRETNSILIFKNQLLTTLKQRSNEQNCIRCGHCANVCPMDLLPQQLQFYGRSGSYEKTQDNRIFDCIECGLCTYVCPSDIPLVQIFQHSKGKIIANRKKKQDAERSKIRFEVRNNRISHEKDKMAKRIAKRRAILEKDSNNRKSNENNQHANKTSNNKLIAAALARTKAKKATKK